MIAASRAQVLLAVPALLTIHNIEEALSMPGALRALPARVAAPIAALVPTYPQFLVALTVVTAIPWAVWGLGRTRAWGITLLLLIQAVMLINVASHVGAAVFLRGYAPGVATAVLFNLPFSVHLLRRALRERWMALRTLPVLLVAAAVIHGPGVVGLMWLAGRVLGRS